ncbi:MAG: hypothetical protein DWQ44_09430 [Bacteroidetes bacterium]|nr:MAG: hypothetical protein DWQ33_02350 [Bacteroidota bacterium]REK06505.1 MAG: hypothetical protein DWQ39_03220 [Bacteroidota bacterium]REK33271.1 MAG: hypothetical protein DWQ44_09430 [Bacteroidota bacterium]REK47108.1 MAG: hypothetical protein DWQ48_13765 [Bacteroidota bacterium]
MFQKARESTYLESTSLLILLIRWRKPLLIVFFMSLIGSVIFSGPAFITPKYRSSVIFFPAHTNSISKSLLDQHTSGKQDLLAFGAEEESEQMLQILHSDLIRETIIKRFGLLEHYGIGPEEKYPLTKLKKEFRANISFSRTEFLSVRIDVLDKDPKLAAAIANEIAALADTLKNSMQNERAQAALSLLVRAIDEKKESVRLKEDSLKNIRAKGVIDYKNQSLIWNEEYAKAFSDFSNERAALSVLEQYKSPEDSSVINTKARIQGAKSRVENLQVKLNLLADLGGASVSLNEELSLEREELSRMQEQLGKLKIDANQNLSSKFTVNQAYPAEEKSYPVRWLIILITVSGAMMISIALILLNEQYKDIQYKI